MSFRGSLSKIIPNWLSNRRKLQVGFKILYAIATVCDVLLDMMVWGVRAPLPGVGTYSALPLIGQMRGVVRGLVETDPQYAASLNRWLQIWEDAGSDEILCQEIQRFLGNSPTVRVISRSGLFTTIAPNGVITQTVDTAWDWDSKSNPERANWWSDIWIVVYPTRPEWIPFLGFLDPNWIAAWGITTQGGIGFAMPRRAVDGIYQITSSLKAAHCWIESIIFCTDNTLFVPHSLGSLGNPDGWWGKWGKQASGLSGPSRTRNTGRGFVRYLTPDRTGG